MDLAARTEHDETTTPAVRDAADDETTTLVSDAVARRFGVSRRTVTRHCVQGRLPARKRDGRWHIALADAQAWALREVAASDAQAPEREPDAFEHVPVGEVRWCVVHRDEALLVGLREPCQALGLDEQAELASLAGRPWAVVRCATLEDESRVMLDRRTLTMWLATLEPARVPVERRALLERYQRDCDALLDGWLLSGAAAVNDDVELAPAPLPTLHEVLDRLEQHTARLAALERWMSERKAEHDAALEPVAQDAGDPQSVADWRARVNRTLHAYCQLSQVSYRLAWREAYVRLYYHCGIDAARRQRVRGTSTTIEVLTEQELRWLHTIVVQMAREWQRSQLGGDA